MRRGDGREGEGEGRGKKEGPPCGLLSFNIKGRIRIFQGMLFLIGLNMMLKNRVARRGDRITRIQDFL
jgi:hypothetical protein